MTLNPADIAAAVALVGGLGLVVKAGRIAGRVEKTLEDRDGAFKAMTEDLKQFRRETTEQFHVVAERFLEVVRVQGEHSAMLDDVRGRMDRGGI